MYMTSIDMDQAIECPMDQEHTHGQGAWHVAWVCQQSRFKHCSGDSGH